jgi:hypothetical protein
MGGGGCVKRRSPLPEREEPTAKKAVTAAGFGAYLPTPRDPALSAFAVVPGGKGRRRVKLRTRPKGMTVYAHMKQLGLIAL